MSPGNDRGAPRQEDAATLVTTNDTTVTPGHDISAVDAPYRRRGATGPLSCEHLRPRGRYCAKCVRVRRRVQLELDTIAPAHHRPDAPWTFGLDEDQLRAEADRLRDLGWSIDEITATLAVEPRVAS